MIAALCSHHTINGEADVAKVVDPTSSMLASLIGCLPESGGAALQHMRDSLVCPAPFWHLDLPYATLFGKFGPDKLVVFVNAILCEVTAPLHACTAIDIHSNPNVTLTLLYIANPFGKRTNQPIT